MILANRSLILVVAAILIAAPALAQSTDKTVTLVVTEADLVVIAEGLNEIPAKRANPLFTKLNEQIKAQAAPKDPPKDASKP